MMRIHQAVLFANDLPRMTGFYRDVIGFRLIGKSASNDWIEFDAGGISFGLHALSGASVMVLDTPREAQSCKLVLSVDNLAVARERFTAAGVTILDRPWGGWDITDPEGNVLGVSEAR